MKYFFLNARKGLQLSGACWRRLTRRFWEPLKLGVIIYGQPLIANHWDSQSQSIQSRSRWAGMKAVRGSRVTYLANAGAGRRTLHTFAFLTSSTLLHSTSFLFISYGYHFCVHFLEHGQFQDEMKVLPFIVFYYTWEITLPPLCYLC